MKTDQVAILEKEVCRDNKAKLPRHGAIGIILNYSEAAHRQGIVFRGGLISRKDDSLQRNLALISLVNDMVIYFDGRGIAAFEC
ncbi:hypothetical protein KN63_02600 [Smithella sp. F21]|nr:hypothetical protein KN63_02600 [Smithella sp. F21]